MGPFVSRRPRQREKDKKRRNETEEEKKGVVGQQIWPWLQCEIVLAEICVAWHTLREPTCFSLPERMGDELHPTLSSSRAVCTALLSSLWSTREARCDPETSAGPRSRETAMVSCPGWERNPPSKILSNNLQYPPISETNARRDRWCASWLHTRGLTSKTNLPNGR